MSWTWLVARLGSSPRRPRAGERDGVEYHFVDRERFRKMVDDDRFLEWAEVHGNLYGTSRDEVEPRLARGQDVVLDIDVQGAESVRKSVFPFFLFFLLPPSLEELERRLLRRCTDPEDYIRRRLSDARKELARQDDFDLKVKGIFSTGEMTWEHPGGSNTASTHTPPAQPASLTGTGAAPAPAGRSPFVKRT